MYHNSLLTFKDEEFHAIKKYLVEHTLTLIDINRLYILYQLCKDIENKDGDLAEVGVYKGGSLYLMSQVLKDKKIFAFDTFEGMPEVCEHDNAHRKGDFSQTSLEGVQKSVGASNVEYHQGIFPDTSEPIKENKFSFVHIDVDIYKSVIDCSEFFYSRMVPGGYMIYDDYGFITCKGARKAVDEFFADKPERVIYLPTGQALIIKH